MPESSISLEPDNTIGHRKIKSLKPCRVSYCELMSNRECGCCDWHHQLWSDKFGKHGKIEA